MKDQITWEDAELFDYINKIEYMYVPDIDDYQYLVNVSKGGKVSANARKIETPVFGYSEIVAIFKNRYNSVVAETSLNAINKYTKVSDELSLDNKTFRNLLDSLHDKR